MKTRKLFYGVMVLLLIASGITVMVAKINIKSVNYADYIEQSVYSIMPETEYEAMYQFDKINLHTSIDDISTLLSYTEAVLLVTPTDTPEFVGEGLLNRCKIKKVIQGQGFEENQMIQIYDLIAWCRMSNTTYLKGSTPLDKNNDYIVFIKKATRPNKQDTYIFSSIPYGHIKISDSLDVLENYNEPTISVKQAMDYQFVFDKDTSSELIQVYKENCKEIINNYRDSVQ